MSKSKVIQTPDGMIIVDSSMDVEDFDPSSMLPSESFYGQGKVPETPKEDDVVVINGKEFRGKLKTYTVTQNGVTDKTIVRLVLVL